MQGGEIEGRCQLFSHGILSLSWIIKNGKRVGEVTNYENGKALLKESWASLFGDGERRVIENTNGGLIMSIRYDSPKGNEEIVVYRGGFDEKMPRYQDWEFVLRAAKVERILLLNEPLLTLYFQEKSISNSTTMEKNIWHF